MSLRVLVSGMACGDPWQGGATWALAQYVLGLRRLGHDVWLVEPVAADLDRRYAAEVVHAFQLENRAAFVARGTASTVVGVPYEQLRAVHFDVHLNVAGLLEDPALVEEIPTRVYLDLDPAFTQLWHATQEVDMRLEGHTHFVTAGQAIGTPSCPIPTCGVDWIPTLPPVVLEHWVEAAVNGARGYTTVGNWRSYGSIEHAGIRYGQRAHSMRAFFDLPDRVGLPCQVALAIDGGERVDLAALVAHGWQLVDPLTAAGTPERYRSFLRGSRAEIGIAKSGYVLSRCGWFSDRSACYLACGRPVVAQDTGAHLIPEGRGLVAFSSLDDAVGAIEDVERDYTGHASVARELAVEYLDSDRVLTGLLEAVGVG